MPTGAFGNTFATPSFALSDRLGLARGSPTQLAANLGRRLPALALRLGEALGVEEMPRRHLEHAGDPVDGREPDALPPLCLDVLEVSGRESGPLRDGLLAPASHQPQAADVGAEDFHGGHATRLACCLQSKHAMGLACCSHPPGLPGNPTHRTMPTIPSKVEQRIKDGLKRFAPILVAQRDRDVSEADTVTVVKDILSDVLGYDKYLEVTSEHAIRGTYCDLAIKLEGKLRLLIEVKAIGIQLAEKHTKQAVDYATNQGLDWVALTNGIRWMLYRIHFKKPIEAKLVAEFDLLATDLKSESDLEKVYLISREGLIRGAVVEFSEKQSATSKYLIAALLLHDEDVLTGIRRELRKVTGILVEPAVIAEVLRNDIIKREALEGEEATQSERRILKENRRGKDEPAPTAPTASSEPAAADAGEIVQADAPPSAP